MPEKVFRPLISFALSGKYFAIQINGFHVHKLKADDRQNSMSAKKKTTILIHDSNRKLNNLGIEISF